jgi:hypothetical protein
MPGLLLLIGVGEFGDIRGHRVAVLHEGGVGLVVSIVW